ncbi:GH92 family glycosyl hydrolase [Edaphobacter aggregans]|uniref:GH92 family glycosyl hydrolase n=1 Tax=Edaphobacter aggregans TaxID=570835 RepID=UPI00054DB673|nr:GH92 family glycosyl hydrolase [Edaphobacter aggregans]
MTLSARRLTLLLLLSTPLLAQTPYSLVDPHIGTAHEGQTSPAVGEPFAMTNFIPETRSTEKKCIAPYYFADTKLTGLRASHWMSGSCTQDYGSVTLMPTFGDLQPQPDARATAFAHTDEIAQPAFYSVRLPAYSETVEMTGGVRAGMLRVSYSKAGTANLIIEPNARMKDGWIKVDLAHKEITGYNPAYRIYQGNGKPAGFKGYFVIRFNNAPESSGTWCDAKTTSDSELNGEGKCEHMGAYLRFDLSAPRTLLFKTGTSFTSIEAARHNLDAEIPAWDFAALRAKTTSAWTAALDEIAIQGGSPAQRRVFYTALYHAMMLPRIVSDADGSYPHFANGGQVEKIAKGNYYDDLSLWDIYRAQLPLLTLLEPARDQEMMQSLVLKGEQGGYLPIFPSWNSYTSEMIGDHTGIAITDAYAKGLRNFDVASAWRLIRQNAFDTPPYEQYKDGLGRRALQSYTKYGYIPLEDPVAEAFHHGEQVSRTLEYSFDDAIIAHLASALGHSDDAATLAKRSGNWKNVIDPETKLARGRHQDGTWITPFIYDKWVSYITESNAWQYTFYVPHDVDGLIQTLGGNAAFIDKLDGLFSNHLYDPGNEPGHHIPYLYDQAGAAWKTQERIASLIAVYNDTPAGLPGNDDAGQMSAWWIFSALGFYPVAPGIPEYWIGTPLFPSATLNLPNGAKFTVVAKNAGPQNIYIQSAQLNGKPLTTPRIPHDAIVKGGVLEFTMGPQPNHSLFSTAAH